MIAAKAVGGPLSKAKITADITWDGRVRLPNAQPKDTTVRAFHPGFYYYDDHQGVWVWKQGRIVRVSERHALDPRNWKLVFDS